MSDLANALKNTKRGPARVPTLIDEILAELGKEDPTAAKEFQRALDDAKRVSATGLSKVMTENGRPISAQAILTYRQRHPVKA